MKDYKTQGLPATKQFTFPLLIQLSHLASLLTNTLDQILFPNIQDKNMMSPASSIHSVPESF